MQPLDSTVARSYLREVSTYIHAYLIHILTCLFYSTSFSTYILGTTSSPLVQRQHITYYVHLHLHKIDCLNIQ